MRGCEKCANTQTHAREETPRVRPGPSPRSCRVSALLKRPMDFRVATGRQGRRREENACTRRHQLHTTRHKPTTPRSAHPAVRRSAEARSELAGCTREGTPHIAPPYSDWHNQRAFVRCAVLCFKSGGVANCQTQLFVPPRTAAERRARDARPAPLTRREPRAAGWLLDQATSSTAYKKHLSRCAQPESRCPV